MRKIATILILIVSLGFVFAGAVSAQEPATVDVAVINEDLSPVDVTCPGDEVAVQVNASANDQTVIDPGVVIKVDPETGLQFEPEEAMMWDGTQWIQNDVNDPFFYWDDDFQCWVW